jgi:hypothetical protein
MFLFDLIVVHFEKSLIKTKEIKFGLHLNVNLSFLTSHFALGILFRDIIYFWDVVPLGFWDFPSITIGPCFWEQISELMPFQDMSLFTLGHHLRHHLPLYIGRHLNLRHHLGCLPILG